MTDSPAPHVAANIERFAGFADIYDQYRPAVPVVLIDLLTQLIHVPRPALVVDLGSGTGLSTRVWADRADRVIGIEPGDDMRHQAELRSAQLGNVEYQSGLSTATGLPDACADIVTVSQALHWMEPIGTFNEVARILRPGGIFAAIDNDWPPTIDLEAEALYDIFNERVEHIMAERQYNREIKGWPKSEHFARITASGHFRRVKELAVHSVEQGNAERMVGLALSGALQTLLKNGITEEELGVSQFRTDMHRILGDGQHSMYFTYRVRLGMK